MASLFDEILADSPTVLIRGNEPSGTNAADATGNNHPGTLDTGAAFGRAAIVASDTCIDLTASGNSWVDIADHAAFDTGDAAFSLVAVIKRDVINTNCVIATKGAGASNMSWRFAASGDYMAFGFPAADHTYGDLAHDDTDRHLYVVTYDGTTHVLYEDGVDVTDSTADATYVDSAESWRLGATHAGGSLLDGGIAYFAVIPSAISGARVSAYWAGIDTAPTPLPPGQKSLRYLQAVHRASLW